jgi:hypothetical protein
LLTSLQKTGTFVDFSMPLDIQRPRYIKVSYTSTLEDTYSEDIIYQTRQ